MLILLTCYLTIVLLLTTSIWCQGIDLRRAGSPFMGNWDSFCDRLPGPRWLASVLAALAWPLFLVYLLARQES